jgi:hypothetical protein
MGLYSKTLIPGFFWIILIKIVGLNYFLEACYLRKANRPMENGFVVLVVVGC